MEKIIEDMQREFQEQLANVSVGYLKLGLEHYHKKRFYYEIYPQVLVGNLGIAIELMLKAFLAEKKIELVLKKIPIELQAFFATPKDFVDSQRIKPYQIELLGSKFKTIQLDDCISLFYIFCPDLKQEMASHLRYLSSCRNTSVHSFMPKFEKYQLDRVVFMAISIYCTFEKKDTFKHFKYKLTDADNIFLEEYDKDRIERVQKALIDSREKAKSLSARTVSICEDWQVMGVDCPACGNEGALYGDTEETYNDPDSEPSLHFIGDSFECSECGLELLDSKELELAGIETTQDYDHRIEEWLHEGECGEYY